MLRAVASQILSGTWANKPSSAAQGSSYFATDVGDHGTMFQYGVDRWRVSNGIAKLKMIDRTADIANAETIVSQTLMPAALLQAGDVLRITVATAKSGTTDTLSLTCRIGTAGTTGDTALSGLSAFTLMSAAAQSGGAVFDIKLLSATSVRKVGSTTSGNGSYTSAVSTIVEGSATTITNVSNALYLSVAIASSGTTNTVAIQSGSIELVTP